MTYEPLESLHGRVAVITGAMGGIGLATAQRLAAKGARVVGIVRRNAEQAQIEFDKLANHGLQHMIVCADLLDSQQLADAFVQIKKLGRVDVLVNAVGKTQRIAPTDLDSITDEYFDQMTQQNLRTYYSAIRTFAPLLTATPESVIVNIGSTAGTTSRGSNVAYAAAKAGIDALTRSLALHMAPVRVLSVSPGAISTNFVPNPLDKYYEMMARTTPLRRVTSVVDVAATVEACVMLLRFCSGIVITVDGARHVWR